MTSKLPVTRIQTGFDQILRRAAEIVAADAAAALPRLLSLAGESLGTDTLALYRLGPELEMSLLAGKDAQVLRVQADRCLAAGEKTGCEGAALVWDSTDKPLGLWTAILTEEARQEWPDMSQALAPFFAIALRQTLWQDNMSAAQAQVERRIREVSTVYEIGQAMDKVEIDRLLDMITEKAAAVMEAQACSLLLRLPETDSLVIAASFGLPNDVVENSRIFVGSSVAGHVVETGQPLLLNSLADDPRFRGSGIDSVPDVSSSICMPMKDENGQVQGVLCIRRRAAGPLFTEEDLRLFSIFATQAGLAINNAQLYAKLNHKLQELSTLAALTEVITSTLDLDQVLNQVADNIVDIVHFDRCRIYLLDVETGRFSPRIVRGHYRAALTDLDSQVGMGVGVIGMVAQRQMPLFVEDIDEALPMIREYAVSLDMEAFYAQPIVARGRCIGVVVVSNSGPQRSIVRSDIELLSTFVHQAGIAIENARIIAGQEKRYAELTTLYEVSKTLAATSGVQKAAQTVNDLATQITDSDAGLLLMFDDTHEGLSALHWRGVSETLGKRLRSFITPVPVSAAAQTLRAPRILTADDASLLFGPDWQPICDAFLARHRAAALVPLVVDDVAVGFLILGKHGTDYGDQELKLIAVASSQAATVLQSASSYERRIGQRDLELSAVYELMQKVRAATTLEEALSSILDIVASLVWSDESSLLTVDENGTTMTVRAARGEQAEKIIGVQTLALDGDSVAARALRARTALIGSETAAVNTTSPDPNAMRSRLAIPLVVADELIGVLMMESRTPNLYTGESVMLLHLVASQAATIYREITSLRNLTNYTDNILRSIAAGVITADKNGYIVTWNKRAEEIVNLQASQFIGMHYSAFIQLLQINLPVREETMRMVELTAKTGKVFTRNQLCYRSPQGDETYLNLSVSQLCSEAGDYLGVVAVFEDVTNEVQMKEEVERVSKLAETGQLAANIAHELRNPLSSIKGAAQLLRKELPADLMAEHGEFLDMIVQEVNGLDRIATEFLEFSRVTPPEMRSVSIVAILSRLLQFMSAYLTDQDVQVVLNLEDDLPELWLDQAQIEQVIKNIVINAVQAMPHGGTLTVTTYCQPEQDIIDIDFADTGVGISAAKIDKICTPFFTTKTKGTGLGLAIVRKIVETHGGRLVIRSTPGEGSTFTVQFPIQPVPAGMMPASRMEITDQRHDQAGQVYEAWAVYSA
ncbi:MAG: GAF domain-containing protein [Janthinobacterium lividum]